ncbi:hypothetical protein BH23PLA1_BH23PLA1_32480 [soil metagenome]
MTWTRFSIAKLMVVISAIAINCAWLRNILVGNGSVLGIGDGDSGILDLGIIVMLNLLAFGLLRLATRQGEGRPFLVGFEVAGLVAVLFFTSCCWLFPTIFVLDFILMKIQWIHEFYMGNLPAVTPGFDQDQLYPWFVLVPLLTIYTIILTIPLLLVATFGGIVAQQFHKSRKMGIVHHFDLGHSTPSS